MTHDAVDYRKRAIGDGYTPPLCKDCRHGRDERRPIGSAPPILTCDRYRSLVDGVTRDPCSVVRNFRCGWQGAGFEAKATRGVALARSIDRAELLALWKKHGGGHHGPHVEHVSMPMYDNFFEFCAELREGGNG